MWWPRGDAPEAPGRHCELLRDQSSLWRGRGRQWEYSHADQPGPRLQEPPISAAEGQAHGRDERRIHHVSQNRESRVKWHLLTNSCSEPYKRYRTIGYLTRLKDAVEEVRCLKKSPRSARFSRARDTGRWGLAEVCRAGILMILMPPGGDAGGGVYICLVPDPKWKFWLKLWQRNCCETGGGITITMNKLSSFLLCTAVTLCPLAAKPKPPPTLQPVNLGSAAPFAVFGGSGVTCTGASVITGDLGVYPIAGTAVTGFFTDDGGNGPCKVIGNIQDNDTGPETTAAKHAAASLTIAINDAKGRTGAFTAVGPGTSFVDLAGATLTPGLYKSTSTLALTGNVTLTGAGVYIFQIATGLTVSNTSKVILAGGATAANVFWQVGTLASLGSTVAFQGNILAGAGVTMISGTTLAGRALSQTNVTFDTNNVTLP